MRRLVARVDSPGKMTSEGDKVIALDQARENGLDTAFDRAAGIKPCTIGRDGACCRACSLGPCRLVGKHTMGVCGATLDTVVARNMARMVAAGAAAHSDHGRDLAVTLREVALGNAKDYQIGDERKLRWVAGFLGVETAGREVREIALEVAEKALAEYGQQEGELAYLRRAPEKRQAVWRKAGLSPRGVDREVVETLHRTVMGNDQDAEHILDQALRTALASGWGGSMLATDLTDILFGTPQPRPSNAGLGVLEEQQVNILVHGHEPTLSEMIVTAARDPELIAYARGQGAEGINVAGICCTSNEVLMRQGVPSAGNFMDQELAMTTGAVEMMVVDVQCIFQSLASLSKRFHTLFITTSSKAKIEGAIHKQFHEEHAMELAKELVRMACDNFKNRKAIHYPTEKSRLVAGYSHEYIEYMLGGRYRASFWPLNDNIINGRILGVAAVVGCDSIRNAQGEPEAPIMGIIKELIARDVLVVVTGCSAIAAGKHGYLSPETLEHAGPGLAEVCEAIGISPVLHLGSCVDNSRILTVLSAMVEVGGLGTDISDLPAAGAAPEWMSEKALEIGAYCAASGAAVFFGLPDPLLAAPDVAEIMTKGWNERFGGSMTFCDPREIADRIVKTIEGKRTALGINVKKERVLFDMEARRALA